MSSMVSLGMTRTHSCSLARAGLRHHLQLPRHQHLRFLAICAVLTTQRFAITRTCAVVAPLAAVRAMLLAARTTLDARVLEPHTLLVRWKAVLGVVSVCMCHRVQLQCLPLVSCMGPGETWVCHWHVGEESPRREAQSVQILLSHLG